MGVDPPLTSEFVYGMKSAPLTFNSSCEDLSLDLAVRWGLFYFTLPDCCPFSFGDMGRIFFGTYQSLHSRVLGNRLSFVDRAVSHPPHPPLGRDFYKSLSLIGAFPIDKSYHMHSAMQVFMHNCFRG
jgi:hypothetical protein